MVLEGIDPIEARRAECTDQRAIAARGRTFDECARAFIRANRAGWKSSKHAGQWESTLADYALPVIGSLSARDIDTTLVVSVLGRSGCRSDTRCCRRVLRVVRRSAGTDASTGSSAFAADSSSKYPRVRASPYGRRRDFASPRRC